jgi:chromosome segregation ATPase
MKPTPRRYPHFSKRGSAGAQPAASLPHLMQRLEGLEHRLSQLKTGLSNLLQLQQLQEQSESHLADRQALSETLATLQQDIDEFELELATQTLGWQHVRETFWQAVRFGGLGVVMGWFLAWAVMGQS